MDRAGLEIKTTDNYGTESGYWKRAKPGKKEEKEKNLRKGRTQRMALPGIRRQGNSFKLIFRGSQT